MENYLNNEQSESLLGTYPIGYNLSNNVKLKSNQKRKGTCNMVKSRKHTDNSKRLACSGQCLSSIRGPKSKFQDMVWIITKFHLWCGLVTPNPRKEIFPLICITNRIIPTNETNGANTINLYHCTRFKNLDPE